MSKCHKCGTDYTNRGGPSLECDCGRKIDLGRVGEDDQASARMVETMNKAVELIKAGNIADLCAMTFGVGAAIGKARFLARRAGLTDGVNGADRLYELVRDALQSGFRK